jgi:Aromatic-ring-opening dioxygenase LigAB, LigA subunit
MSAALERFLAQLYTDRDARARFAADPRAEAQRAGLSDAESAALERIDRAGLEMAARSFERKRTKRHTD